MCDLLVLKKKINLLKTPYFLVLFFIVLFLIGCETDQEENKPVSFPNDDIKSVNESQEPIKPGANDEGGRKEHNNIIIMQTKARLGEPIISMSYHFGLFYVESSTWSILNDPNFVYANGFEDGVSPLILVWSDGTTIWSEDQECGGQPYHLSKIELSDIRVLFEKLYNIDYFAETNPRRGYVYFKGHYVRINITDEVNRTVLSRTDEYTLLDDEDPVSDEELIKFNEQDIERYLHDKPEKYQNFLRSWITARQALHELIPKKSGY